MQKTIPPSRVGVQSDKATASQTGILRAKLAQLQAELEQAEEREKRLLADYQNLQRHTQEERLRLLKMANKDFCLLLLEPLEHLTLAAEHLNDDGLNMVLEQLWRRLHELGVEKLPVLGKKFDLETMEVVDKQGKAEKVIQVVKNGYSLAGEVIQHAQVILG